MFLSAPCLIVVGNIAKMNHPQASVPTTLKASTWLDILDRASLATIRIPVDIVNLGRPGEIPVSVQASTVADAIPDADYALIEDASHFSMFGACKPGAAQIAEEAGINDPVCSDGTGRSRQAIHAHLIDMAEAAFRRRLNDAAR